MLNQDMAKPLVLILFLAFFAFSSYADETIDCGASDLYTDENSVVWIGDENVIFTGEPMTVKRGNAASDHVMNTLRVFTSRRKNCYAFSGYKDGKVLVRASFFYGNYDAKSVPPVFDMHFDGNFWVTVKTTLDTVVYYEVIYVVKGDSLSVCLAQTEPNQFPFISALEVWGLGSNMYSYVDSNYAMFLKARVAYGANSTIRYSEDSYGRIWVPASGGTGLTVVTSDAIFIDTATAADNPPGSAVQNAITTSGTSEIISLSPSFPAMEVPIYMTMYFSEVTELEGSSSTQNRSFRIYIDDKPSSESIYPPYGSVTEMVISNISASANTTFSLVPTSASTLPPLINAMEVYYVSDPLTDGTNSDDVEGLGELQTAFNVLNEWSGDPCLPYPYTWDWLNCSTGTTPRVTALYLSGFDLQGSLPDFSSMVALEIIDLHNNSIIGLIPEFLGSFPKLKELNLADNAFSGLIPASISMNNKLKLVVSGNPDLCVSDKKCETSIDTGSSSGTPSVSKKKKSKLPAILGSTIPSVIVVWAIIGVFAVLRHKRKTAAVALAATGNGGGANGRPHGTQQAQGSQANNGLWGKMEESKVNEMMVNIIQEQPVSTEMSNQLGDSQAQHDNSTNYN